MPTKRRAASSSSQSAAADSLSQSSSSSASPKRPPKRMKLQSAMKAVADEFDSLSGQAATGSGPPKAQKQVDTEFFLCMRAVDDGKTGWFDKTPGGLKLDAPCRLGDPGRYKCRYLNLRSDESDGTTSRAVAQALVVAQVKCFQHLYDTRNARRKTTPPTLNTFIREAKSRAVMFDETSGEIDVVARFNNVTATNDLQVLLREHRDDSDSDQDDDESGFSPPPVRATNISRLEEGGTVRFSGKLNAYDHGGSKYGVSLYLGKEIVYTAPTSVQSSDD